MRRFSLLGVMSLIAALTVAGFAVAQDAPWAEDFDDTFTWSYEEHDDGTASIYWYVGDEEVDCSDPEALHELCNETEVVDNSGEGLNHGDYVSAFAQDAPEGPGRGCLIAAVATSDAGMPEDSEAGEQEKGGCPAGLYDWLQTFAGEDNEGGQPTWVQDMLAEKGVGAAGNGNGNGGPPFPVPGGPGNGNG